MASQSSAVIFDMDGVLLDSEPLHYEAVRQALAEQGVDFPF
ncbi:MAG: HAD family phosphatase, partial [Chloroflexi bacterium]|nr:HAD family phosphatase [Chloroflexota bacterium]